MDKLGPSTKDVFEITREMELDWNKSECPRSFPACHMADGYTLSTF